MREEPGEHDAIAELARALEDVLEPRPSGPELARALGDALEPRPSGPELARALEDVLEPRPSGLPPDGPRTLWHGARAVAWSASPARIVGELEGAARVTAHPAAPRVLAHRARAIALEPIAGELEDPIEALVAIAPRAPRTIDGSVRDHLASVGGPISVPRALARIAGRSRVDRLLARRLRIATRVGPVLGGLHPGWLRRTPDGRAIALSTRHAREEGWSALELAAADAHGLADLREVHAEGLDPTDANAAYDLALLSLLAREAVIGRGAEAERAAARIDDVLARLLPRDEPFVRVRVEGPQWLGAARWEGDAVPAAQARWTLRELDGLVVGGETLRVHVHPPLRAGRAAPPWRPRSVRRRELFSRWDRGVRHDDAGLFSATPEALAEQIARGASGVVIDGTCGLGSIAIALARRPEVTRVIAVDLDAERLAMARHNAGIYEVEQKITFVHGDVRDVIARERADRLVLDPPWGGRDYDRARVALGDLPLDVRPLIDAFEGVIVLKLPRSIDARELPGWAIEPGIDARGVLKLLIARRA